MNSPSLTESGFTVSLSFSITGLPPMIDTSMSSATAWLAPLHYRSAQSQLGTMLFSAGSARSRGSLHTRVGTPSLLFSGR